MLKTVIEDEKKYPRDFGLPIESYIAVRLKEEISDYREEKRL